MTDKPVTIIPLPKDKVLSALYAVAGSLKTGSDYKEQSYKLIQELITLVEAGSEENIPKNTSHHQKIY